MTVYASCDLTIPYAYEANQAPYWRATAVLTDLDRAKEWAEGNYDSSRAYPSIVLALPDDARPHSVPARISLDAGKVVYRNRAAENSPHASDLATL